MDDKNIKGSLLSLLDTIIVKSDNDIEDSVYIDICDVDDIAKVWINNDEKEFDEIKELKAEWANGCHGESKKNISGILTEGDNYIIFALFNKVFNSSVIFKGGKWSYGLKLVINQKEVWNKFQYKSDYEEIIEQLKKDKGELKNIGFLTKLGRWIKENQSNYIGNRSEKEENIILGIKYWKIFKLTVKRERVIFSEIVRQSKVNEIMKKIEQENVDFLKSDNTHAFLKKKVSK